MAIVWKEYKALFIIGPYFFEETGALGPIIVTVTGQRYDCLLCNNIIPVHQHLGCRDDSFARWHCSTHCKTCELAAEAAFRK